MPDQKESLEELENSQKDIDHDKYVGKTNLPDYIVPSGVQLTENLNEEIAEAVGHKTPEMPAEK